MTPNLDHKPVTFREFLACALRIVGWHADTKDSVARRSDAPGWGFTFHASVPLEPKALAVTYGRNAVYLA